MRKRRMSLEEYVDFLSSNKSIDLTVNYLDQIIRIHGYRMAKGTQKKTLIDAIAALDPIDPSRSTLTENNKISSSTTVSLEDVISDLKALEWQECCVTSIQTLNAQKEISPSSSSAVVAAAASGIVCDMECVESKGNDKKEDLKTMFFSGIYDREEQVEKTTNNKKKKKRRRSLVAESGGGDGYWNRCSPSSALNACF